MAYSIAQARWVNLVLLSCCCPPPFPFHIVLPLQVRRRMRGKTANPELAARQRAAAAGESAVAAEAWADLVGLDSDPRRKHIHWTHVRTSNLADRQPESFTRQGFVEHLRTVYKDVYPEPANPSGSILLFGAVAKERHAQSKDEECRAEHHHAQVFCSTRHMWKRVACHSHSVSLAVTNQGSGRNVAMVIWSVYLEPHTALLVLAAVC